MHVAVESSTDVPKLDAIMQLAQSKLKQFCFPKTPLIHLLPFTVAVIVHGKKDWEKKRGEKLRIEQKVVYHQRFTCQIAQPGK